MKSDVCVYCVCVFYANCITAQFDSTNAFINKFIGSTFNFTTLRNERIRNINVAIKNSTYILSILIDFN